jgi:hemoglobin/transferrin/lactoferrin receptor protein
MHASADKISTPDTANPTSLSKSWNDTVANITLNYRLNLQQNLYAGLAQGFRAPNLSDLTRFDTARTNEFEIPSTDLDSEHYTNLSVGYKYYSNQLLLDWSVFYTLVRDQIERIPTGNQNADGEFEISKENIGDGYFTGSELSIKYALNPSWSFSGQLAYLSGKADTFPGSERIKVREYASRLMPTTFQAELQYTAPQDPWWLALNMTAADKADRLSTRDTLDTGRIPPGGTPGYTNINVRFGYQYSPQLNLTLAMENLFDQDYRIHGSGQNEAGRNVILGLSGTLE